jgi:biotin carboxyl carrier protein
VAAVNAGTLDPRGVRVSVVGQEMDGPAPIVVEPAPMANVTAPRTTGARLPGDIGQRPTEPVSESSAAGRDDPVTIDGTALEAALRPLGPGRWVLDAPDGTSHRVLLLPASTAGWTLPPGVARHEVVIDGWRVEIDVQSATRAALEDRARRGRDEAGRSGPTEVHAIIPGVVVSVSVAPGDAVTAGQQLLVVEAMKMQNELRAPRDGTIQRVSVGAGATIDVGDLLLVIA